MVSVNANQVHAYYDFQMEYSNTTVTYFVSNIRHNGSRVNLLSWNLRQAFTNLNDAALRDSSRTASFSVSTGDTMRYIQMLGTAYLKHERIM
jgi:hypothetical protein